MSSSNLPSRGGRRQQEGDAASTEPADGPSGSEASAQGPGGRAVQRANRPGAGGPPGREQGRAQGREGRSQGHERARDPRRPAAPSGTTPTTGIGGDVRSTQLGGNALDQPETEADRRRLRTQRALRSPRAVRQTILLREILGPPVALRRHREDPPSLSD